MKINKWDLTKLTGFCTAKETINKMKKKKKPRMGEIFANNAIHEGLISKVYRRPKQTFL